VSISASQVGLGMGFRQPAYTALLRARGHDRLPGGSRGAGGAVTAMATLAVMKKLEDGYLLVLVQ
jgi:hypothetical protein